jgi:hypothetical protein
MWVTLAFQLKMLAPQNEVKNARAVAGASIAANF